MARKAVAPKKPKLRTLKQLKKDADDAFALYIRYRDGRWQKVLPEHSKVFKGAKKGWYTQCITCKNWYPLPKMSAGHFVTRGASDTRFDEENVNGQCYRCNVVMSGEQYLYSVVLREKYGADVPEQLAARRGTPHRFSRAEFLGIIQDAQTCIAYYESNKDASAEAPTVEELQKPKKKRIKKARNTAITNPSEPANLQYIMSRTRVVQK